MDLLLERHIKGIAKIGDEALDCKELIKKPAILGIIAEGLDYKAFSLILVLINDKVSKYVPDRYKDEIHSIIDDVIDKDGNYEQAAVAIGSIIDQIMIDVNAPEWIIDLLKSALSLVKGFLLAKIGK